MSFLYPFLTFLQPGILWPAMADLRPSILAALIGALVGFFMRPQYSRAEAFRSKAFIYLVAFVIAQALSVYYSGVMAMVEEFGFWYPFALFVVVSILLMPTVEALQRYVWGMICGGMVVIVYGIYGVSHWGGYQGTGRAGAYGMYENHNDYSFIIVQILPFVYMYWRQEQKALRRWFLMGSLIACAAGIAMSLSRGGMIALVVEAALIVLIGMEGRRRLWLLPVLAILGTGAIGYQYAKRAENQGGSYTVEDAESSRYELWKAGMNMVLDKPLLGVGSRRFPEYSSRYYELSHDQLGKVSHNTYIEVLSGSGLLGFAAFFLMGRHVIRELRRKPVRPPSAAIEATRKATLISIYTLLLRAFLDAKPHDWSFYTLLAIGIACYFLQREHEATSGAGAVPSEPTQPARIEGGVPPQLRGI